MEASPSAEATAKWWHVADKELEEFVAHMAAPSEDTIGKQCAGFMPAKPPRPRLPHTARAESPRLRLPLTARAERPPVTPGTPLMSHRSPHRPCSASRARPMSARRSSEACSTQVQRLDSQSGDAEKITVHVYNMHSSDKLVFRVRPDLPIGSSEGRTKGGADFGKAGHQLSFKTEIACALGIDEVQIRLLFQGIPMSTEEKTLQCYGVADGDTVHLRVQRASSVGRHDVVLACAAKKMLQDAEWIKEDMLFMRPYAMQSPSRRRSMQDRCAQNGVALMPKWVSQEKPKLFAPVGVGIDGHGNDRTYEDFNLQGIWNAPVDHPNQRGNDQYGLQRVRESIASKCVSYGGA